MRILLINIYILFIGSPLFGQTYSIDPGNIINVTGEVDENLSHYTYFHNTGDSGLILKWKLLENTLDSIGWPVSLCDYSQCYVGLPDSGTMKTLDTSAFGFLKPTVIPNIIGTAYCSFEVYSASNPSYRDTIRYNYYISYPSSLEENDTNFDIYFDRNNIFISVNRIIDKPLMYSIYNLKGQLIQKDVLSEHILINTLVKGVYVFLIGDKTQTKLYSKQFVKY